MFKRILQMLLVACLLAGILWAADNPFVGDWKLNPSKSKLTDQMKVESLGANKYAFDFEGGGAETVVIDGTDQPGIFGTTLSVTAVGPDAWKVVRKKDGRKLISADWRLSKDGATLTDYFTGVSPDGSTFTLVYLYNRTAGGSGFTDTWVSKSLEPDSVFVLQVRPYERDGLSWTDPLEGLTRNVKFDGKDYPLLGSALPPDLVSAVRRVDEHTLEVSDKFKGKINDTELIELSSDLKTLTMTLRSTGSSDPQIRVFERQ
jgi:hypothetical protein